MIHEGGSGVPGNAIADECGVEVNFRFAPDRTVEQAVRYVEETFPGHPIDVRPAAFAPSRLQ